MVFALFSGADTLHAKADVPPFNSIEVGPTFSLTPNPVTGSFFFINLNFTEAQFPEAGIFISDVLGKVVYSYPIRRSDYSTGQVRIDLGDASLDKGIYFVQIKCGDSTKTLKLAIR